MVRVGLGCVGVSSISSSMGTSSPLLGVMVCGGMAWRSRRWAVGLVFWESVVRSVVVSSGVWRAVCGRMDAQ